MILCENRVAEKIAGDQRTAFLTFIGSAEVGWRLRSLLAPGAACALEHGGSAPVIFDDTADLDKSLPLLVKGGYYHAGQVCVSVQRIYVPENRVNEFSAKMTEMVQNLKVGDPMDERTEVGPLITPQEVDRIHEWVLQAKKKGGAILCGGTKVSQTCYAPTLILDPPDEAIMSQKEIFGPVVAVYTCKNRNEAIKRANSLNFSFQAAVFTKNLGLAMDTVKRLNATTVMVNDHTAFRVDWMPFGGNKYSGLGVGGIGPAMREMSIEKLMVINDL